MAAIYPSDINSESLSGQASREWDTLLQLKSSLPDDFSVFHGLHWTRLEAGLTVVGQLQFVLLLPSGGLVCMVMRTGLIKAEQGALLKRLGGQAEDLIETLNGQSDHLAEQVGRAAGCKVLVERILFCPDHRLVEKSGFGIPEERIFDAISAEQLISALVEINRSILRAGLQNQHGKVRQFLLNHLNLVPEISALSHASEFWTLQLQQGLDKWVGRLQFKPFRLQVNGVAGCGKSFLAMNQIRMAQASRERCLYLCYNRPLASHVGKLCRSEQLHGAVSLNFHALCDRLLKDRGIEFDFSQPDAFEKLVEQATALPVDRRWVFDRLIIDEGQDFEPEWFALIDKLAHADSRWIVLQDPAQNLYGKPLMAPGQGWVTLNVETNYRNPRSLVSAIEAFIPLFELANPDVFRMESASPVPGLPIEWFDYIEEAELFDQTGKAITHCLKQGFDRTRIVVLSMRGFSKSAILQKQKLGPHEVKHFTGRYNEQGEQVFTEGALMAESVYRFKGQSADAVVLTEVDFPDFDEQAFRKLFVGLTRAKLMVVIVGQIRTSLKLKEASP